MLADLVLQRGYPTKPNTPIGVNFITIETSLYTTTDNSSTRFTTPCALVLTRLIANPKNTAKTKICNTSPFANAVNGLSGKNIYNRFGECKFFHLHRLFSLCDKIAWIDTRINTRFECHGN